MYQKLVIVGYLGRDPEMRYTPNGVPVTNSSVATNVRWVDANGQQQERTTWFRVTAWRRLAETCSQYLSKGRLVLVEGRLTPDPQTGGPRIWTGNDGVARASYEVTASNVQFLGGAGREDMGGTATEIREAASPELEEEDIPF